jgi:hypothetical protein
MTKYRFGVLLLMATFANSHAQVVSNCDLTGFRWLCKIPVQHKPRHVYTSVIDCDGTTVWVNKRQFEQIMRYQRADVNMTLRVNDEHISSPCIPADWDLKSESRS